MNHKYIEAEFRPYMIFGEHPDGFVDVGDGNIDIVCHVKRCEAERLIADRDRVISALNDALMAHGEKWHEVFEQVRDKK